MNTPCPHCQVEIEIDPATLAALQGHENFPCPACEGLVAVPPASRAPVKVTAAAAIRPPAETSSARPASLHRGLNRNFLILGAATLLVLGGLGFFLASLKSDDTNNTSQIRTNEIINNSYFQKLIASKATTKLDLENLVLIRRCENGFWGLSKERLDWLQAQQLAVRCGARICEGGDSRPCWPNMLKNMENEFPDLLPTTAWIRRDNQAGVRSFAKSQIPVTQFDRSADSFHRVLLYWDTSKTMDHSSPWVHEEIPPPDKDGWITLFDGGSIHGCSPELVAQAGDRIKIHDGILVMFGRRLDFNIKARNLILRVEIMNMDRRNFHIGWREVHARKFFKAYCKDGGRMNSGQVLIGAMITNPDHRNIGLGRTSIPRGEFFVFEISAVDDQLTLSGNGFPAISMTTNEINEAGTISIGSPGRNHVRKIQVKVLDASE